MVIRTRAYQSAHRISKSNFFVLVLIIVFNQTGYTQAWFNTAWAFRKAITVDFTKVSSTQTNFPVSINLSSDAGLSAHALSSGNDILFTSADGTTKLSYERESYTNGTGALTAWVKVPSLSNSANTVIYMYYGNSAASDQQDAVNVWDANYKGVWHLSQNPAGTAPQMKDGTSVNNGTTSNMVAGDQVTGQIGTGWNFNGSNKTVSVANETNFDFESNQAFSIGFWSKSTSTAVNHPVSKLVDATPFNGYEVSFNSPTGNPNRIRVLLENSLSATMDVFATSTKVSDGSWHYFTVTYDGSRTPGGIIIYVDGVSLSTTTSTNTLGTNSILNNQPVMIASRAASSGYYNGALDETRISNTVRSAGWVVTEYNNQNSPSTFYSLSAESLTPPSITSFTPANGCANTVSVVITGASFTGATAVKFGGTDALSFTVNSATQITAIPAGGTTGTISVTTPNGTGSSTSTFTLNPSPAASSTKTDITCFNAGNGTITVSASGGSGSFTGYSITNGLPAGSGYQASPTFNGLAPGQYKIRVKDNAGCESKSVQ